MVDKKSSQVICTSFCIGKKHDFRLFKESKVHWINQTNGIMDSGYTGIKKIQSSVRLPTKRRKGKLLTKEEKQENRKIASERALSENVIG